MRLAEATWIAHQLAAARDRLGRLTLVNVGSQTAEFRKHKQPHIEQLIFAPLQARGDVVIHADLQAGDGIDVTGDLADPATRQKIVEHNCNVVLCSNLLEHVSEPRLFAQWTRQLVGDNGVIVVTVPRSYPYHADPIDNGFRPTPEELASLFPDCSVVIGQVVADTTFAQELWAQKRKGAITAIKTVLGAVLSSPEVRRARRDKLRWLRRPFSTSCVVLRAMG